MGAACESQPPNRPGAISDDPLIDAIHRRAVEIVFWAYAALLVYVSFVPFDITAQPKPALPGYTVWGLAVVPFSIPDILANLGLFVPLGVLGFLVGRRKGRGRIVSGLLAAGFTFALGFGIEHAQYFVASRVSTWVDVTCNVLGAAVGAILVCLGEGQMRRTFGRARWAVGRNWQLTFCKAAVCIVLLVHLRPYDAVVDLFHAAASLRHADVSPLARWNALPALVAMEVEKDFRRGANELPRARWEYALDRLTDVAGYAAIAALVVLGLERQFRRRFLLHIWAGFVVVSLATMITLIRVFLISHGLDTAHVVCGVVAWPLGCAAASWVMRRKAPSTVLKTQCSSLPPLARLGIAFSLLVVLAYELVPFDFGARSASDPLRGSFGLPADRLCLLPFEAHFHSRPNIAVLDLSGDVIRYATLGVCLALALEHGSRKPWRRRLWITVLSAVAVSFAMECLHLLMPSRQVDTTTLLMAAAGGFAGAVGLKWLHDYRVAAGVVAVEDLLTSQLIEGETYQKLPQTPRPKPVQTDPP